MENNYTTSKREESQLYSLKHVIAAQDWTCLGPAASEMLLPHSLSVSETERAAKEGNETGT